MMRGHRALHLGDRGAIRQLGGDAPGVAAPALQLGDGVVDTRFRASDDHRTPAMSDDVDGDLSTDAGAAADNNDLLGLKMHWVPPWSSRRLRLTAALAATTRDVLPGAAAPQKG
ncbi:hypothetical protein MSTO_21320 [Mycobacterium stomatepiae]|uniref:Uncharacterized protein n=1 Tax=Mycobacterium stomatepiae TaxID=470076 RepID=A0A7I7Q7C9_9MYCO|nr:hypothetical protein MSTO_21320 [Mycobacterium stomatepiae]